MTGYNPGLTKLRGYTQCHRIALSYGLLLRALTSPTNHLLVCQFFGELNEARPWRCSRSSCRCQLVLTLMTAVLDEAGGKTWLLGPCDSSVTAFSAFTPGIPALHRRSGSRQCIRGLECTLGFNLLQSLFDHLWGSFICSAPFDSVSEFTLRFDLTSTAHYICNCSESGRVHDINPTQVWHLAS